MSGAKRLGDAACNGAGSDPVGTTMVRYALGGKLLMTANFGVRMRLLAGSAVNLDR